MNRSGSGTEEDIDVDYVVKLRGLPWSATKEDILDFFSECRIHKGRDGIHLVTTPEGRSSGEAFVELPPKEDINNFIKKDKETMGPRYIEVMKVKKAEMDWFLRRSRPSNSSSSNFRGGGEDCESFVRLRGLPFECTKEDIQDFFKGLEIVPNGIQLMVDTYGRSSGESYVQFASNSEAEKAFKTKDKQSIGHRYVEIFRVGPSELRSIQMLVSRPSGRPSYNNRSTPYDRQGRDRDSGSRYGGGGGGGGGSRPTRYFSKGFEEDSWNSYGSDSGSGGGGWNRSGNSAPPYAGGSKRGGGGRSSSRGGGGSSGGSGHGGRSAHCVLMRGLPFKAAEDNIRQFFHPLDPTAIHIIYESSGRPSGTAKVEFSSDDDVTLAMAKHKERMEHRYIELFVHSV